MTAAASYLQFFISRCEFGFDLDADHRLRGARKLIRSGGTHGS
jgi:hypothetical protein